MFDVMDILKSHEQNARFPLRVDIMLTEAVRLVPRTDVVKISLCSLTENRSQAHAAYSAYNLILLICLFKNKQITRSLLCSNNHFDSPNLAY